MPYSFLLDLHILYRISVLRIIYCTLLVPYSLPVHPSCWFPNSETPLLVLFCLLAPVQSITFILEVAVHLLVVTWGIDVLSWFWYCMLRYSYVFYTYYHCITLLLPLPTVCIRIVHVHAVCCVLYLVVIQLYMTWHTSWLKQVQTG